MAFDGTTIMETAEAGPTARTIDELMQIQSAINPYGVVVSYPSSGTNYVDYNLRQLNNFAFHVAKGYEKDFPQRTSSLEKAAVVGLIGVSNLDYIVTMLALTKLGHTVLLMSPRISQPAYEHLLTNTGSHGLVYQHAFQEKAVQLQKTLPGLTIKEVPAECNYGDVFRDMRSTRMDAHFDLDKEISQVAWVFHSSGSTGLPKPIYITHKAALGNYRRNMDYLGFRSFLTLPVYHTHGISSLFRAFISGQTIRIFNAALPLTTQHLVGCMKGFEAEIFCTVPYALKILHETSHGVEFLRRFKIVTFGGAPCPDPLGDSLTALGVKLVTIYGMGETGPLMTSWRPDGDDAWTYLRPSAEAEKFLVFEQRDGDLYELVVGQGWPSKVATNRPDGSYATKDLFLKHPTLNAWKYSGRIDDVIVLEKGEKANPLPIEGAVRQNDLVSEAVVFGVGKPHFGIAIILSPMAGDLSRENIVNNLLPVVEESQELLPDYAKISSDMMILLPHDTIYPRTDKGTVIRKAFYAQFAAKIDNAYVDEVSASAQTYTEQELKSLIRSEMLKLMGRPADSPLGDEEDFFHLGMDSLQASRLRGTISKRVNTNGNRLDLSVVFDNPSIASLARKLHNYRTGLSPVSSSSEVEMQGLIEKYGKFGNGLRKTHDREQYIVLTGATGSLGAHLLAKLAQSGDVQTIYCLVRATSESEAHKRVVHSLVARKLYHNLSILARRKIRPLPSTLALPTLGLDRDVYEQIAMQVTSVYHIAWNVNFNLRLRSFEQDCIAGMRNLIDLCLKPGKIPARFAFCSSVGVVLRTDGGVVGEHLPDTFSTTQPTGYAQSKLVAEHICVNAIAETEVPIFILRVGQIIGDTKCGIWNDSEAVPLMLQTSKTVGALPTIDESLRWLPVDVVAQSMIEIANSDAPAGFFNLVNPYTLHWTRELLPYLHRAGLEFKELDPPAWLAALRASSSDPIENPPVKLMEYLTNNYDTTAPRRTFEFQTDNAQRFSITFKNTFAPDEALVGRMVRHFVASSWKTSNLVNGFHSTIPLVIIASEYDTHQAETLAAALSSRLDIPMLKSEEVVPNEPSENTLRAVHVVSQPLTRKDRDLWRERSEDSALFLILQMEDFKAFACTVEDDEIDVLPLDAQSKSCEMLEEALWWVRDRFAT